MSYLKTIKPIFVTLALAEYSQIHITDEGKPK
jgi:hypothetical protein